MRACAFFVWLIVPWCLAGGRLGAQGLSVKYPGDVGIARHPAVLFHDDFETGELADHWTEIKRRAGREASDLSEPAIFEEAPAVARGQRSVRVQLRRTGYEDVTLIKYLKPGHDELFMRHYVRYGRDYGYHGHGGSGFMADAGQGGFKGAGKAPDGDKFFWATLEPIGPRKWEPPGALIFYAYWWQMKADGRGNFWGNWFQPDPDFVPALDTWTCVEWRVKANTNKQSNGELDCWINGEKRGEFRDINWRSDDKLKVNRVQLSLWLEPGSYDRAGGGNTRTVWYDDVVVATQYIGPKRDR